MKSFDFEFRMVPFNDLRPDPTNIRTKHNGDDDRNLKQSILVNGLIQPLIVCEDDKSGYLIVDGHRTRDACREIFEESNPEVPCLVVSKEASKQFTVEELRKNRLLREIHTQKINDWDRIVAIKLYADDMKRENPDITQEEIAGTLGKKHSWLSQIVTTVTKGTLAPAIEMGDISYEKSRILRKAPEDAQKALIDATKGFTLHDTERIVKQVSMGVSVAEAVRAVELSRTPEIQVAEAEVKERFAETGEDPQLPQVEDHSPSASKTPELPVHEGEGETTEEAIDETIDDSGREPLQPSSPETTGIVAQTLGLTTDEERTTSELEKEEEALGEEKGIAAVEPSPETEKPAKDPFPIMSRVAKEFETIKKMNDDNQKKQIDNLPEDKLKSVWKTRRKTGMECFCQSARWRGKLDGESYEMSKLICIRPCVVDLSVEKISSTKEIENAKSTLSDMKLKIDKNLDLLAKRGG